MSLAGADMQEFIDQERFEQIRKDALCSVRQHKGIGTLKEKTVHAVLKDYYTPEREMQEVRLKGYVADIFTGSEVIEIQTAGFNRLREKLDRFLPEYPVTIVYPILGTKWISWIDEQTGVCSSPRKSPVKGNVYKAFYELYKIKPYLKDPNLRLCFPFLDMEEYRLLNGWSRDRKRGACRYDRIPVSLTKEVRFDRIEDYGRLIPADLPEPFTSAEFAKAVSIPKKEGGRVLHILNYLQVIERCGKKGRLYLYIRKIQNKEESNESHKKSDH